jgi:hypothetical protein
MAGAVGAGGQAFAAADAAIGDDCDMAGRGVIAVFDRAGRDAGVTIDAFVGIDANNRGK